MNVSESVSSRCSVRAFLDVMGPLETVRQVRDGARWAQSGRSFQPWEAVVLTGKLLKVLREWLLASERDLPQEYDYFAPSQVEKYHLRRQACGAALYGAAGIAQDNTEARDAFNKSNVRSSVAPVLLLCHFLKLMVAVQWSDIGIWLQIIMLLLREEWLDSCPQEFLGHYCRGIKGSLRLLEETLLFARTELGKHNPDASVAGFLSERVALDEHVTLQRFEDRTPAGALA